MLYALKVRIISRSLAYIYTFIIYTHIVHFFRVKDFTIMIYDFDCMAPLRASTVVTISQDDRGY